MHPSLATARARSVALLHGALTRSVGAALAAALTIAAPAHAQRTRDTWVPNGPVYSVATANGLVYLGGTFTQLGPPIGAFAALDVGTGAAIQPYLSVVGTVNAVSTDGAGGWYIGGQFVAVQGQLRQNLARLDASGHVTSWAPATSPTCTINALSLDGGTLYVGGQFDHLGGRPRANLGGVDAVAGLATTGDPYADAVVTSLLQIGNTLFVGGAFGSLGGMARGSLAALDLTYGSVTPWNPPAVMSGSSLVNGFVQTLATEGGTIYVGGNFLGIGGYARSYFAAFTSSVLDVAGRGGPAPRRAARWGGADRMGRAR
jgi:hypothetical protein